MNIKTFIVDYCQRHAHPVNASLHLIGVPVVLYGLYYCLEKAPAAGLAFIALGYFFQYLGHRAQGNEVGEVTLIKHCLRFAANKFKQKENISKKRMHTTNDNASAIPTHANTGN